jgi:hypothetical protein
MWRKTPPINKPFPLFVRRLAFCIIDYIIIFDLKVKNGEQERIVVVSPRLGAATAKPAKREEGG